MTTVVLRKGLSQAMLDAEVGAHNTDAEAHLNIARGGG